MVYIWSWNHGGNEHVLYALHLSLKIGVWPSIQQNSCILETEFNLTTVKCGMYSMHCGKMFGINILQRHINAVHLKLKSHTCDQCKKAFSSKSNLKQHINGVHLKLKPWICDQCGNPFCSKQQLKRHTDAVHLRLKPWWCDQCGKAFSCRLLLENHVETIHLKLKPWKSS